MRYLINWYNVETEQWCKREFMSKSVAMDFADSLVGMDNLISVSIGWVAQ